MIRPANPDAVRHTLPLIGMKRVDPAEIIAVVLDSASLQSHKNELERAGLRIEPESIVYKDVLDTLACVIFPVTGGAIEVGAVVAMECLFDRKLDQTVLVQTLHAGAEVDSSIGPSGAPIFAYTPQVGEDGKHADRRFVEHKRALWHRFLLDRPLLGEMDAGQRWRDAFYWSLQRRFFCCGCPQCQWRSPFFESPDPNVPREVLGGTEGAFRPTLCAEQGAIVDIILHSQAWGVELERAQREGLTILDHPRFLKTLSDQQVQVIFPTNSPAIHVGGLVAVWFAVHVPSQSVVSIARLSAGSETNTGWEAGEGEADVAESFSQSVNKKALAAYHSWRHDAWLEFWMNDLEHGPEFASHRWLANFWMALEALLGGNEIVSTVEQSASLDTHARADETTREEKETVIPSLAIENIGGRCFTGHAAYRKPGELRALGISTLMVNIGHRCNQACGHCHVNAGPNRTEAMDRETVELVLKATRNLNIKTLDITGGAPELNPHFRHLASEARRLGCEVVDRCNLTILFEPGFEDLPEFFAEHAIQITASLPSDDAEVTDRQRGLGTFGKSIAAIRKLNDIGYAQPNSGLVLNLVYNPSGLDVPESQQVLEARFKHELFERHGILFDRLLAMNNMPIKRFEHYLKRVGQWSGYMNRLVRTFNADTLDGLMCRRSISVGYDGRLYDCDFNHALDIAIEPDLPTHVRDLCDPSLQRRLINVAGHCFGCASGAGSSCNGALAVVSSKEGGAVR